MCPLPFFTGFEFIIKQDVEAQSWISEREGSLFWEDGFYFLTQRFPLLVAFYIRILQIILTRQFRVFKDVRPTLINNGLFFSVCVSSYYGVFTSLTRVKYPSCCSVIHKHEYQFLSCLITEFCFFFPHSPVMFIVQNTSLSYLFYGRFNKSKLTD